MLKGDLKIIVDYFGLDGIDDATTKVPLIIAHFEQERVESYDSLEPEEIVQEILDRIKSGEMYQRPMVHCHHFSELLKELDVYFGHDCEVVYGNPTFVNGHNHSLVFDRTSGVYRDGAIYRNVYVDGRWIPIEESDIDKNNIPLEMINLID